MNTREWCSHLISQLVSKCISLLSSLDVPKFTKLPLNIIHDLILGFTILHFCQGLHLLIDRSSSKMWWIKWNAVMCEMNSLSLAGHQFLPHVHSVVADSCGLVYKLSCLYFCKLCHCDLCCLMPSISDFSCCTMMFWPPSICIICRDGQHC